MIMRVLLDGEFFAEWGGELSALADFGEIDVNRLSYDPASLAEAERLWRDLQLKETDLLMVSDYPIEAEKADEVRAYRQTLRNWPDHESFPDQQHRPQPPSWLNR